MGYSRKVEEGSSFPMVVISDRAAHFMARNLNLKMGFFQTKNRRNWTTRWNNPTKISGNIDLLEQWFSNCVPRHLGVPSEIQRVPQIFFDKTKYLSFSIEIWLIFQLKMAQCYS
jgi:hypothetical protein